MDAKPADAHMDQALVAGKVVAAHSAIQARISEALAAAREQRKIDNRLRTAELAAQLPLAGDHAQL